MLHDREHRRLSRRGIVVDLRRIGEAVDPREQGWVEHGLNRAGGGYCAVVQQDQPVGQGGGQGSRSWEAIRTPICLSSASLRRSCDSSTWWRTRSRNVLGSSSSNALGPCTRHRPTKISGVGVGRLTIHRWAGPEDRPERGARPLRESPPCRRGFSEAERAPMRARGRDAGHRRRSAPAREPAAAADMRHSGQD